VHQDQRASAGQARTFAVGRRALDIGMSIGYALC